MQQDPSLLKQPRFLVNDTPPGMDLKVKSGNLGPREI
jgi:hypothetical protein